MLDINLKIKIDPKILWNDQIFCESGIFYNNLKVRLILIYKIKKTFLFRRILTFIKVKIIYYRVIWKNQKFRILLLLRRKKCGYKIEDEQTNFWKWHFSNSRIPSVWKCWKVESFSQHFYACAKRYDCSRIAEKFPITKE